MARHHLDAKDLTCPLPVLRARKKLKSLTAGDVLEIEATDPAAEQDFPAFCDASGNVLRSATLRDGIYVFEIEKAG